MQAIDLRAERLNRGMTTPQVEEQLGLYQGQLWRIEEGQQGNPHGTRDPEPKTKFKIAGFYGHKVTDIWPVREAEEPEPKEAA